MALPEQGTLEWVDMEDRVRRDIGEMVLSSWAAYKDEVPDRSLAFYHDPKLNEKFLSLVFLNNRRAKQVSMALPNFSPLPKLPPTAIMDHMRSIITSGVLFCNQPILQDLLMDGVLIKEEDDRRTIRTSSNDWTVYTPSYLLPTLGLATRLKGDQVYSVKLI